MHDFYSLNRFTRILTMTFNFVQKFILSKFKITFRSISYLAERKFKSPLTRRQRRCNPCASLKLNQSLEKHARWWICGLRFQRIQRQQWNKKKKITTIHSHLRAHPRRFLILRRPQRVIPSADLKGRIRSDHRRHLWTPRNVVDKTLAFFKIFPYDWCSVAFKLMISLGFP